MKLLISVLIYLVSVPLLYAQNSVQEKILQYMISCDPCIDAYEYIGFIGSGEFDGYEYDEGKIVRVPTNSSSTMTNGWYDYIVNIKKHIINYENTSANKMCISTRYGARFKDGPPAKDWNGKEQEIKNDTVITTYNTDAFEILNDSTYLINSKKIIFADKRIAIISSVEKDLWNINIELEDHGFPLRIYSNARRVDVRFRYTRFDAKGNWIERETINDNGDVLLTVNRVIKYKNTVCVRCYGSGRVFPNNFHGPDECTGICSRCGGSGKGPLKIYCTESHLKELQDSVINGQEISYKRMMEYKRRKYFLNKEKEIQKR